MRYESNSKIYKIYSYTVVKDYYNPNMDCFGVETVEKNYFTDNFSNWTSENYDINELIRDPQKKAKELTDYIEWIPYSEFGDMTRIDEGRFGTVYRTIWKSGPLTMIRGKIERSEQIYEELSQSFFNGGLGQLHEILEHFYKFGPISIYLRPCNVAIKILNHSDDNMENFLNELKAHIKSGLVHRDLHAGNILIGYDNNAYLADLGLSCLENEQQSKFNYGVLPFIAPEVLRNRKYTFASDVYSFGIIMWMLTSGQSPFDDYEYDHSLEMEICRCWNPDLSKRPPAIELYNTFKFWYLGKCYRQFKNADRFSALRELREVINSDQSDLSTVPIQHHLEFRP
ncbi:kinase-like domain-containing protein [Rhizophagus irregularis DAOM 181602=DAOM 197198]|uniref:Kinase-like domain-containing protein n=1 Tax=Rhizophagus irregularis (strain DAOM 181602 / DAOM 197198 / MUCL 43194) TaxID=747089 RepID=A0A2P4P7P2_RHIID|nr:kinase-like domain-containing protein [Rhizophagus irregularis DAOM 181602=DAOM 197198]POG61402.1 kinase-like domain-containing protein [Rhizophagus irregularis DAOM 181602=DAOM 197198]|eukprot:XP_025168268.1 kinase-like domain-containing protein [Rhizophagus irregularis DAOM 181602=DAOM 197198]